METASRLTARKRAKTIDVLTRWHWLMKDIAADLALRKVKIDMGIYVTYDPEEATGPLCGTTACAAGAAALAGLFRGFKLSLDNPEISRSFNHSDWERPRVVLGMSRSDWNDIILGDNVLIRDPETGRLVGEDGYYVVDRAATADRVANVIAQVLADTYEVDPVPKILVKDRPWRRQQAAFPAARSART